MSKIDLTQEQKQEWQDWLNERPENVRKVAEKILPWKEYRDIRARDIGNRYSPISYEDKSDGTVTIPCLKSNEEMPGLGGYCVFGMSAENLIEADR